MGREDSRVVADFRLPIADLVLVPGFRSFKSGSTFEGLDEVKDQRSKAKDQIGNWQSEIGNVKKFPWIRAQPSRF
jgi:hypothetical protein